MVISIGAISAAERSRATPIFKVESNISDRLSQYIGLYFVSARKTIRYKVWTNTALKRLGQQDFLTSLIWARQQCLL